MAVCSPVCSLTFCLGVMDLGLFAACPRDKHFPVGGGCLWTAFFCARSEGLGGLNTEDGSENQSSLPEQTLYVSAAGVTELKEEGVGGVAGVARDSWPSYSCTCICTCVD